MGLSSVIICYNSSIAFVAGGQQTRVCQIEVNRFGLLMFTHQKLMI
ncbi:Uncharacterised protein [Legionella lansingensis]|nr:hypothetical protein [Legionella lansingensis]SNV47665.1 Uncharacterised protein [Legionella lansingensis]